MFCWSASLRFSIWAFISSSTDDAMWRPAVRRSME
ncbi:citrate synthase, putative [Leishmania tarentolae]|uniref:Citrate synthase, putative n=1 Tax=Leishmania tarentolae TaxID=5689 RepID=A0A640KDK8_LEITA|nr:citrate synthase, putative [Leishmania tarentolae]